MMSPLNNVLTFRNAHTRLQCTTYQARGGINFPRQMTLAFRMQNPTAKESGECVVRGIPYNASICHNGYTDASICDWYNVYIDAPRSFIPITLATVVPLLLHIIQAESRFL
jgi:hypothetical protein